MGVHDISPVTTETIEYLIKKISPKKTKKKYPTKTPGETENIGDQSSTENSTYQLNGIYHQKYNLIENP